MSEETSKEPAAEPVAEAPVPVADAAPPTAAHAPQAEAALSGVADGFRTKDTYNVSIEQFEGPLDLLLHLVRRHELDILDIPISFVAEKYLEYIEFARALDIEIAGDYLVMAATLAYLKSRELLPPTPEELEDEAIEDDGVDPREELVRRLIEYERFRAAGEDLNERPVVGRDVFSRGSELDVQALERDLAPITLFRLADAYNRVLERAKISTAHEVELEVVDVRTRMRQLSMMLIDKPQVSFEGLFLERPWGSERELRQMLVVTLMSVLELVKLGALAIHQASGSDVLLLERAAEPEEVSRIIDSFTEDEG